MEQEGAPCQCGSADTGLGTRAEGFQLKKGVF